MRVDISRNVMTDLKLLSMELRRLFVQEIVGERREMYESYTIPENQVDYPSEANKFGFYASYLGDTMPSALATVLQSPIIVITANTDNTVMYITPEVVTTEYSLFLIYNPTGPGHYDAALPYREPAAPRTQTLPTVKPANPVSCSCGINSSDPGRKSCIPLEHYSTRCRCYKASQSCTSHCRCKDCANPHGTKGGKRQRRAHSLQVEIPDLLSTEVKLCPLPSGLTLSQSL